VKTHAVAAALVVTMACTACSSSDEEQTDARIALSFARSASMWLDGWMNDGVPRAYVKRSLESTGEALGKRIDKLPGSISSSVSAPMKDIAHDLDTARHAVDAGDKARVELVLSRLRKSTAALDAWKQTHRDSGS
jgi:hypothetical protein